MADLTLACPNCKTEIRITEQLAGPIVAATRAEYEKKMAQKSAEAVDQEKRIREREEALQRERDSIDQRIADGLRLDRPKIAAEEAKKAQLAVKNDLEQRAAEVAVLKENLKQNDAKLAEAQKEQADMLRQKREIEEMRREMDLTIEKRTQANLTAERDKARAEIESAMHLKFAEKDLRISEKDQTIAAMKKQLEEAQRKAEQGSQQSQGEALELQLEALLAAKFPHDQVVPVPKGEHGGDILQRVFTPAGLSCGTILWESKRTKTWSDGWLPKLREDQGTAKAEIAVIISTILPKGIDSFDFIDNVWIAHPRCLLPIALVLRSTLMEVAAARQSAQGIQTKAELVYQYLKGPRFKLRVQAIVEAFTHM